MDPYVISASLKEIRSGTRSQWRLMSAWVMCPDRRILKISRDAAFWTDWRRWMRLAGSPNRKILYLNASVALASTEGNPQLCHADLQEIGNCYDHHIGINSPDQHFRFSLLSHVLNMDKDPRVYFLMRAGSKCWSYGQQDGRQELCLPNYWLHQCELLVLPAPCYQMMRCLFLHCASAKSLHRETVYVIQDLWYLASIATRSPAAIFRSKFVSFSLIACCRTVWSNQSKCRRGMEFAVRTTVSE